MVAIVDHFAYVLSTHTQTTSPIFSFGNGLQRALYKRKVSGLQTVPKKSLACKLVFSLYEFKGVMKRPTPSICSYVEIYQG